MVLDAYLVETILVKHVHIIFNVAEGLLEANAIALEKNMLDHGEAIQGYLFST